MNFPTVGGKFAAKDVEGGVPDAPQAAARSKSITSHYILYSFAEFCYNGSIPFIIGHFEGVIL